MHGLSMGIIDLPLGDPFVNGKSITMITIISGSNRKDNLTFHFAKYAYDLMKVSTEMPVGFLDLASIDSLVALSQMYSADQQPEPVRQLQDDYILPASKFWFFVPEYNGSYPGMLKLIIDSVSVRLYQENFTGKKASITGVASGRAGNLRGMDHLADVLNHLGVYVHPNKPPISSIDKFLDNDNNIIDEGTQEMLKKQMAELLLF